MPSRPTPPVRDRVKSHRERLRAQGLRPIQIWVPDVRSSSFVKEARRQARAVARSASAADDQGFIDAISRDDE
ncbi:MAG: antitoxin MazE family protein [Candidatus Dormibacteraeota bacterium]|nr:antitoxin MazE family protein [Candidatus Dormibacteraeota bacterium]